MYTTAHNTLTCECGCRQMSHCPACRRRWQLGRHPVDAAGQPTGPCDLVWAARLPAVLGRGPRWRPPGCTAAPSVDVGVAMEREALASATWRWMPPRG